MAKFFGTPGNTGFARWDATLELSSLKGKCSTWSLMEAAWPFELITWIESVVSTSITYVSNIHMAILREHAHNKPGTSVLFCRIAQKHLDSFCDCCQRRSQEYEEKAFSMQICSAEGCKKGEKRGRRWSTGSTQMKKTLKIWRSVGDL